MRIEAARQEDLDTVAALLREQFEEHHIDMERGQLSDAVRGLLSDRSRGSVLLAYHDTVPVGVAVLAYTFTLEHGGRVAWLDELFVSPAHRGRGTGRALLHRALDVARDRGCHAVDLEVDAHHLRAERLYEREGFVALPRRRWAKRLT
jgi:GNAT superfamily N-acetyltransferase